MSQSLKDNPIILSTGVYFRAFKHEINPINKVIEFYADHFIGKIDGIELRLKRKEDLLHLNLSKKSIHFLAELQWNTIHYFEPIEINAKSDVQMASVTKMMAKIETQEFNVKGETVKDASFNSIFISNYLPKPMNLSRQLYTQQCMYT